MKKPGGRWILSASLLSLVLSGPVPMNILPTETPEEDAPCRVIVALEIAVVLRGDDPCVRIPGENLFPLGFGDHFHVVLFLLLVFLT